MPTNDDTVVPSQEILKANQKALKEQEKQTKIDVEKEAERKEREAKIDADIATRTSRMDQDLKERARAVGINPDNFEEEHVLGEAVRKVEEENANKVEEK